LRVIATAGHVDHGKSTLVRALTGVDPDRLAEERARGMTIDLGFAATTLPGGEDIAFVDVPGHARFVKNMLAGVGAVDSCLFVVDATEGWKAQSEEHLRILELLGVSYGVVALTKVAGLDDDSRELAAWEVAEHLAGTFLAEAEMVAVDVPARVGTDALVAALGRLAASTPPAVDSDRPRLWVDRSFAVRGSGTVVTGTLTGGRLAVDNQLVVEPGGRRVRVRGLQSHHASLREARPGRRVAVNLAGISHSQLHRGQALVRRGQWHLSVVIDATLMVLGTVEHPVSHRGAYTAHIGSAEIPVRMRLLGRRREIAPGSSAPIRLWLSTPGLPLLPGDRFVLREAGRAETIGGGEILDVDPVLPVARADPSLSVDRVIAERGWVEAGQLERLTGERRPPNVGRWVVGPDAIAAARDQVVSVCKKAGEVGIELANFDERRRALLAAEIPGAVVVQGRVYEAGRAPSGLSSAAREALSQLETAPWSPPDLPLTSRGALRELERHGLAVQTGGLWFATSAIEAATQVMAELLGRDPHGLTVSAARQALGVTRRHALPLLEHLDRQGLTRRHGDVRIAGPRMTRPTAAPGPPAPDSG